MKSPTLFLLALFFQLILCLPLQGLDSPENSAESKPAWVNDYLKMLPAELCQADQEMMRCYEVTQEACLADLATYLNACLAHMDFPSVENPEATLRAKKITVLCAQDLYRIMMGHKRTLQNGCSKEPPSKETTS